MGGDGSWTSLSPSGTAPAARFAPAVVKTSGVNGFYIFGGNGAGDSQHLSGVQNFTCSGSSPETPAQVF